MTAAGASAQARAAAKALFRAEYERLARDVYGGLLPPFPGVRLTSGTQRLGSTRMRVDRTTGARSLLGFTLSALVVDDAVRLDTIRHEIAHAAAFVLDGERGHGDAWRAHAVRCGARPAARTSEPVEVDREPIGAASCARCGWRRLYHRVGPLLRNPAKYRCSRCRGPVVAERFTAR